MDVEVISGILLGMRCQNDFWAWHYEKRGVLGEISISHSGDE